MPKTLQQQSPIQLAANYILPGLELEPFVDEEKISYLAYWTKAVLEEAFKDDPNGRQRIAAAYLAATDALELAKV